MPRINTGFSWSLVALLFFGVSAPDAAAKPDAEKILESAEKIRNPTDDYVVTAYISDLKKGKKEDHTYEVSIKGRNKALVRYVAPPIDQGTQVLMVEDQMWIYVPSTAKPIRISARQRLTGNAAYGDITRLNFVGNYKPAITGEEKLDGKRAYKLDLTAIEGKQVTYDRIEYWVDAKNFNPLRALYKTSSGKTLREGTFEKYEMVLGQQHPTEFILTDFLEKDHVTKISFKNAKKVPLPELLFEKQNLGRES